MGSGKSVVGALVADRAGVPFADLDLMAEERAGMPVAEIFATGGEASFRALEKEVLPRALAKGGVVALGGGAVIDDDNWTLISGSATTVYLEAPFDTLWRRVAHLAGRPLLAHRTREEAEALFERRRPRYEQADHTVDGDRDAQAVAADVMKLWSA